MKEGRREGVKEGRSEIGPTHQNSEFSELKMGSPNSFLSCKHLKLKLRVFLTGYAVAVETSEVKN